MWKKNRYRVVAEQHRSKADTSPLAIKVGNAVVLPVQSHRKINVIAFERKRLGGRDLSNCRDESSPSAARPAGQRESKPVSDQASGAFCEMESRAERIQRIGPQLLGDAVDESMSTAFEPGAGN